MKIKDEKKNVLNQDIKRKPRPKLDRRVTEEQVEKYSRGEGTSKRGIRTKFFKDKNLKNEELARFSVRQCKLYFYNI